MIPASHSILLTSIRSFSKPVKPLPPNAITYTSTSLLRTPADISFCILAFVIEKILSTPNEMPTHGICFLPENMPTSSS